MLKKVLSKVSILQVSLLFVIFSIALVNGCAVSAKNTEGNPGVATAEKNVPAADKPEEKSTVAQNSTSKNKIKFSAGSPADTVRIFYKNLRERRFREAMLMTNLRFAIEGLSESEMQDLNSDFEPLAAQTPENIEIRGEIITNGLATVTVKMPNAETGQDELEELQLRDEKGSWVIITADEKAEALAKKEGKNYFFTLRLDIHHAEARAMMERIAKAQAVYAMQNVGAFADLPTLVSQNLLPEDIGNTKSTGYRFTILVSPDNKKYTAHGVPDVYRKSGKISYLLNCEGAAEKANLKFNDNKGQMLKK